MDALSFFPFFIHFFWNYFLLLFFYLLIIYFFFMHFSSAKVHVHFFFFFYVLFGDQIPERNMWHPQYIKYSSSQQTAICFLSRKST